MKTFTCLLLIATFLAANLAADAEAPAPAEALPTVAAEPVAGTPFFIALSVASADVSAAWYERVLGFEVVREQKLPERGIEIAILRRDDALLELIAHQEARGRGDLEPPVERIFLLRGVFKFGFRVDDLDAAVARLEALAVPLRGRVIAEPDGSSRSLQVEDPDGNVIQLFELTEARKEGAEAGS